MSEQANRLVPILREGVEIIKMVFFKELRDHFRKKYPARGASYPNKLAGAVINELFGTPNPQRQFMAFAKENRSIIQQELRAIPTNFGNMRIPLTDALRVQFLCDDIEGVERVEVLQQARDLGILIVERDVPLPKNFLNLVRRLGSAFNLIIPPEGI